MRERDGDRTSIATVGSRRKMLLGQCQFCRSAACGHAQKSSRAALQRIGAAHRALRRGARESASRAAERQALSHRSRMVLASGRQRRAARCGGLLEDVRPPVVRRGRVSTAKHRWRSAAEPTLVAFASSGWWMPVVKTDHRDHDLWVFGGDGNSSFRRRVAYVWGRVALGEPERTNRMTTD